MSDQIKNIVILGGGSAGWLTAGTLAAKHRQTSNKPYAITLIESPEVKIIGVGEGTWPTMRGTLKTMGINESAFIRECDVSFKQGAKFVSWRLKDKNEFNKILNLKCIFSKIKEYINNDTLFSDTIFFNKNNYFLELIKNIEFKYSIDFKTIFEVIFK